VNLAVRNLQSCCRDRSRHAVPGTRVWAGVVYWRFHIFAFFRFKLLTVAPLCATSLALIRNLTAQKMARNLNDNIEKPFTHFVRFEVLTAASMKMVVFWWRQRAPLKHRQISTGLHDAASQKTVIFKVTHLTYIFMFLIPVRKTIRLRRPEVNSHPSITRNRSTDFITEERIFRV
jgi:hypothetical protein